MKKEITDKQHRELLDLGYAGGNRIADLIEFLGDDLWDIQNWSKVDNLKIGYTVTIEIDGDKSIQGCYTASNKELKDALWEDCKYKLKNL